MTPFLFNWTCLLKSVSVLKHCGRFACFCCSSALGCRPGSLLEVHAMSIVFLSKELVEVVLIDAFASTMSCFCMPESQVFLFGISLLPLRLQLDYSISLASWHLVRHGSPCLRLSIRFEKYRHMAWAQYLKMKVCVFCASCHFHIFFDFAYFAFAERLHGFEAQLLPPDCHGGLIELDGKYRTEMVEYHNDCTLSGAPGTEVEVFGEIHFLQNAKLQGSITFHGVKGNQKNIVAWMSKVPLNLLSPMWSSSTVGAKIQRMEVVSMSKVRWFSEKAV